MSFNVAMLRVWPWFTTKLLTHASLNNQNNRMHGKTVDLNNR